MDSISRQLLRASQASVGDPHFANVSLLLHCNGTNGSTTFTDSSPSPKTISRNGGTSISTAQSKFGGASVLFGGGSDRLYAANNGAFEFGSGDFTLDAWIRPTTISGTYVLLDRGDYSNYSPWLLIQSDAQLRLACTASGSSWAVNIMSADVLTANVWQLVSVSRVGNVFRLFHDGIQVATTTTAITLAASSANPQIGNEPSGTYSFTGYMDDIRVTKGVGRYTGNFTLPTAPFPDF